MEMKKEFSHSLFGNLVFKLSIIIFFMYVGVSIAQIVNDSITNSTSSLDLSLDQVSNDSNNPTKNRDTMSDNQDDDQKNKLFQLLSASIGFIIGGILTFLATLRSLKIGSRISYISIILKNEEYVTNLGRFIQKINIDPKSPIITKEIKDEIDTTWFFLLFSPSKNIYKKLIKQIRVDEDWEGSLNTIAKFLGGNW